MPFLRYVYTKMIDKDQERVQRKGYSYVNTVHLDPYEKLMPHAHNSSNTHFIVEGEMTMFYTKEADMKEGPELGNYKTGDFVEIKAKKCYRAVAGAKGCTFVEGHKDLSPTSAERFERMGMLTKTPTGGMKDTGRVMINCTRGRCHWSDNSMYHMCAEFGDENSPKRLCDVKKYVLSRKSPRQGREFERKEIC